MQFLQLLPVSFLDLQPICVWKDHHMLLWQFKIQDSVWGAQSTWQVSYSDAVFPANSH